MTAGKEEDRVRKMIGGGERARAEGGRALKRAGHSKAWRIERLGQC